MVLRSPLDALSFLEPQHKKVIVSKKLTGQLAFVMAHSLERAPGLKLTGNIPGTQPLGSNNYYISTVVRTLYGPHIFPISADDFIYME